MKILIVGYQGYIGSGLYKYLSREHDVIGWGKSDNILSINTYIEQHFGSFGNCFNY